MPCVPRDSEDHRYLRITCLGLFLLMNGCQFSEPPIEGTFFRCGANATCPPGFDCRAGVCEADPTIDAGARADAREPSPARADARVDDPPIDGSLDPGPRTLVFGEHDAADVRGVTVDTWLDADNVNATHGSSPELQIDTNPKQVSLIRFDLAAIPSGSVIDEAELHFTIFDPASSGDRVRARVLLRSWDEREASWNDAANNRRWPSPGASGDALDSDIAGSVSADTSGERTLSLTPSTVQAWIDDPATNLGLRLEVSSSNNNDVRLHSREAAQANRPFLRVTFH